MSARAAILAGASQVMDRLTGTVLSGTASLAQQVADVLTTPIGSRVMRRDYGSLLPLLIGQPLNARTRLQIYAATAAALERWIPRLRLRATVLDFQPDGSALLRLEAIDRTAPGQPGLSLSVPLSRQNPSALA